MLRRGPTTDTAGEPPSLFPKTDPAVDGPECLADCDSCSVAYPRGFKIDNSDELYGMVKGWMTHLVVGTGKSDWVRDVADERGSVMEAVEKAEKPSNGVSDVPVLMFCFCLLFLQRVGWFLCVSSTGEKFRDAIRGIIK